MLGIRLHLEIVNSFFQFLLQYTATKDHFLSGKRFHEHATTNICPKSKLKSNYFELSHKLIKGPETVVL